MGTGLGGGHGYKLLLSSRTARESFLTICVAHTMARDLSLSRSCAHTSQRGPLIVFQIIGFMRKVPREKTRPGVASLFSQYLLRRDEGSYLHSFTFEATIVYTDSCQFYPFLLRRMSSRARLERLSMARNNKK